MSPDKMLRILLFCLCVSAASVLGQRYQDSPVSLDFFNTNSDAGVARSPFKCERDGLFEDENDCQMYYECLWIGSAFEKQEHLRCAHRLIYNPRKHRCNSISEFEAQFANGVHTGEELLEFMRFRNCIGSKVFMQQASAEQAPVTNPFLHSGFENTSPPADYYPVVIDYRNSEPSRQEPVPARTLVADSPIISSQSEMPLTPVQPVNVYGEPQPKSAPIGVDRPIVEEPKQPTTQEVSTQEIPVTDSESSTTPQVPPSTTVNADDADQSGNSSEAHAPRIIISNVAGQPESIPTSTVEITEVPFSSTTFENSESTTVPVTTTATVNATNPVQTASVNTTSVVQSTRVPENDEDDDEETETKELTDAISSTETTLPLTTQLDSSSEEKSASTTTLSIPQSSTSVVSSTIITEMPVETTTNELTATTTVPVSNLSTSTIVLMKKEQKGFFITKVLDSNNNNKTLGSVNSPKMDNIKIIGASKSKSVFRTFDGKNFSAILKPKQKQKTTTNFFKIFIQRRVMESDLSNSKERSAIKNKILNELHRPVLEASNAPNASSIVHSNSLEFETEDVHVASKSGLRNSKSSSANQLLDKDQETKDEQYITSLRNGSYIFGANLNSSQYSEKKPAVELSFGQNKGVDSRSKVDYDEQQVTSSTRTRTQTPSSTSTLASTSVAPLNETTTTPVVATSTPLSTKPRASAKRSRKNPKHRPRSRKYKKPATNQTTTTATGATLAPESTTVELTYRTRKLLSINDIEDDDETSENTMSLSSMSSYSTKQPGMESTQFVPTKPYEDVKASIGSSGSVRKSYMPSNEYNYEETVLSSDEEIDPNNDINYRDKDEAIHQLTNRVMNQLNLDLIGKHQSELKTTRDLLKTIIPAVRMTKRPFNPSSLIDTIEQRLSKKAKSAGKHGKTGDKKTTTGNQTTTQEATEFSTSDATTSTLEFDQTSSSSTAFHRAGPETTVLDSSRSSMDSDGTTVLDLTSYTTEPTTPFDNTVAHASPLKSEDRTSSTQNFASYLSTLFLENLKETTPESTTPTTTTTTTTSTQPPSTTSDYLARASMGPFIFTNGHSQGAKAPRRSIFRKNLKLSKMLPPVVPKPEDYYGDNLSLDGGVTGDDYLRQSQLAESYKQRTNQQRMKLFRDYMHEVEMRRTAEPSQQSTHAPNTTNPIVSFISTKSENSTTPAPTTEESTTAEATTIATSSSTAPPTASSSTSTAPATSTPTNPTTGKVHEITSAVKRDQALDNLEQDQPNRYHEREKIEFKIFSQPGSASESSTTGPETTYSGSRGSGSYKLADLNEPWTTFLSTYSLLTSTDASRLDIQSSAEENKFSSSIPPTSTSSGENMKHYTIPSTSFIPKTNSKPFMQTYRINQTKKLPNQFASLKLSYDTEHPELDPSKNSEYSIVEKPVNVIRRIDEVERGGKFQRLRLVPADTLIECKENDFGLECSCSITLSPPKCKQLINSFLSSCRILGCKNNGRCINMAYKYPIPYVCSCPSAYMGTYCEISREEFMKQEKEQSVSSDEESSSPLWRISHQPATPVSSAYDGSRMDFESSIEEESDVGAGGKSPSKIYKIATASSSTTPIASRTTTPITTTPTTTSTSTTTRRRTTTTTEDYSDEKQPGTTTDKFYQEPLLAEIMSICSPNPCLNEGLCQINGDTFECKCVNDSFSGRFCENFRIMKQTSVSKNNDVNEWNGLPNSDAGRKDDLNSVDASDVPASKLAGGTKSPLAAKDAASSAPTTRSYFWQCPSNCLNNLGRGHCTLSTNGYPLCVCEDEWTGIDCSQKNFCINNRCSNNSTCSNYPEMNAYLCVCPRGFAGRLCEIELRSALDGATKSPIMLPQKKLYTVVSTTRKPAGYTSTVTAVAVNTTREVLLTNNKPQHPLISPKNPCLTDKCKNNGTCVMSFSHSKNRFSFVCKCEKGFYGPLCEKREPNPCMPNPCKSSNGYKTECISLGPRKYECVCMSDNCLYQTTSASTTTKPTAYSGTVFRSLPTKPSKYEGVDSIKASIEESSGERSDTGKWESKERFDIDEDGGSNVSLDREEIDLENLAADMAKTKAKKIKNEHYKHSKISFNASPNPCNNDVDLCRKYPNGNDSFICVKSFLSQDYTLCLPTKSMSCKDSNPCLNGGICVDEPIKSSKKPSWRCICSSEYTGRLCETEICSPVHRLFSNHTMCLKDSPSLITGSVTNEDMELILDMHNTLRRQVAPIAANMQKMYWDVRLQHLAQKRAQLCSVDNTGILMRQQPGYGIVIGENLAAGYEKWSHVLTSWMSESKNFIYKSNSPSDNLQAGHYTQMIYSSASRVGCGFAQCTNTTYDRYFVCYYGEMQTYYSRYEPYQDGKSCSMCENNCDNGLCDCKGAYCSNGGTMDLRTCTCTCPYATFTGRYCENVVCPKDDSPFCSQALFEDKCWLYPVVRATCPYMCSLCTKFSSDHQNATVTVPRLNEIENSTLMSSLQELVDTLKKK